MSLYLVTGAAGFVGSSLVHALLARGERVRGIDNFVTGRAENLEGAGALDLIHADITDPAAIASAMRDVDFVLHEAAIPSVPRSLEDPVRSHEANATGTLRVLEAARAARSVRRVVYASSSSAYGDTEELPKHEQMRPQP
ncbi:MAG: NAD-dependent epimerase/dehydratase family protein, partial [Myxococcota bacterium]